MAVGDVVGGISASVASGAYVTVQPAVGTAYMITTIGGANTTGSAPDAMTLSDPYLFDGTNRIIIHSSSMATFAASAKKIFISNSVYLQIANSHSSASNIGWSGVQIK